MASPTNVYFMPTLPSFYLQIIDLHTKARISALTSAYYLDIGPEDVALVNESRADDVSRCTQTQPIGVEVFGRQLRLNTVITSAKDARFEQVMGQLCHISASQSPSSCTQVEHE